MDDENVERSLNEFVDSVKAIKSSVTDVVKFYKQNLNSLTPIQAAKVDLTIVYLLNACFWLYLATQGQDPRQQDIAKEFERIKIFIDRTEEAETNLRNPKKPRVDKPSETPPETSLKEVWS